MLKDKKNKKTLVILHGWNDSSKSWRLFADQISGIIDVKVPDLPGFGEQPLISDEWGVPDYARWVEEYIEKQKLNNVVLMGHSFGGRIAGFIASKNPKWIKALILYASPSIYRPRLKTRIKIKLYKIAKKLGLIKIAQKFKKTNPELVKADREGLGKIFRKVVPFDQTEMLPKIKCPTLLIWGDKDTKTPLKNGKETCSLINGAKMEIISGGGHNVHLEKPYIFYGIVKKFIQEIYK
jgi:pimeloyl-ACP methyl ester carboxylesterase